MTSAIPGSLDACLAAVLRDVEVIMAGLPPSEIPEALAAIERIRVRGLERLVKAPGGPSEDVLLTMEDVAARLAINIGQARELGRRGEIPTVIVGERFVRVRKAALEEWIKRREAGGRRPGKN